MAEPGAATSMTTVANAPDRKENDARRILPQRALKRMLHAMPVRLIRNPGEWQISVVYAV